MLVKADELLARIAWMDAENTTVANSSNEEDYMYHLKWSKRYWNRGFVNYKKGRPHRAIDDFKSSWKHAMLAMKWTLLNTEDPAPGEMHDPGNMYDECGVSEYEPVPEQPFWLYWYTQDDC
jgi:hypothetical protein